MLSVGHGCRAYDYAVVGAWLCDLAVCMLAAQGVQETWNRVHTYSMVFIPRLITTPSDTILGMGSREINCYTVKLNPGPLAQLCPHPAHL